MNEYLSVGKSAWTELKTRCKPTRVTTVGKPSNYSKHLAGKWHPREFVMDYKPFDVDVCTIWSSLSLCKIIYIARNLKNNLLLFFQNRQTSINSVHTRLYVIYESIMNHSQNKATQNQIVS